MCTPGTGEKKSQRMLLSKEKELRRGCYSKLSSGFQGHHRRWGLCGWSKDDLSLLRISARPTGSEGDAYISAQPARIKVLTNHSNCQQSLGYFLEYLPKMAFIMRRCIHIIHFVWSTDHNWVFCLQWNITNKSMKSSNLSSWNPANYLVFLHETRHKYMLILFFFFSWINRSIKGLIFAALQILPLSV